MRTLGFLLVLICLLGSLTAALARGNAPTWQGWLPDSALIQWTADPAAISGGLMSAETWIWTPVPERAPDVYWLQVYVNGKPTDLAKDMINAGGYYLLPLGDLSQLGLTGQLDPADMMTITISGGGHNLKTAMYSSTATVDGFSQAVPVRARWQRGMVYVSLGMLNQAFSLGVKAPVGGPLTINSATAAPAPAATQ
jgi:hypothetical protein